MSKIIADTNKIKEVLEKGVEKIYPSKEALEKTLKSGTRIKLYCGFDPTSPNLHIGSAVQFRKLAQFQKLGHEVIMLIGDFTTMIGDPTDKSAARKKITRKEILKNAKNYKNLARKILRFSGENPAKIMYNSQWNEKLTFVELIELASNFTVQQMIIRDMFQERLKKDRPIYLHEFLYPLTQAYDSWELDVDLEVGGNDQTFNMLCGRDLMKVLKNKEKFVLTTKLLMDPLGKKMGKTEGNMINLDEKPNEMYGKIMSWPDSLIFPGFELCTDLSIEEVNQIKKKKNKPRDDKARLAREIVAIHHNKVVAQKAEKEFNRVFKERGTPSEVKSYKLGVKNLNILDLLFKTGLAFSKSEAQKLGEQGAKKIDKSTVKNWRVKINIKKGIIIQAGKRKFIKLV